MEIDWMKIGIVVSDYHKGIARQMLNDTQGAAKKNGLDVVLVVKVIGVFDVPLALQRMLSRQDIDAAVVLGVVVQGETAHDEVVAYAAAEAIMQLSLKFDKPVGYGISGPRMTLAQAKSRAKAFSVRAVQAVKRALEES